MDPTSSVDSEPNTADSDEQNAPPWLELLADAHTIAEEYRVDGWEARMLEPHAIEPVDTDEQTGLQVVIPLEEYEDTAAVIDREASFNAAEVYYRPLEDRHLALAVERDTAREIAVFVPLTYDVTAPETRHILEQALEDGQLRIYVHPRTADANGSEAAGDETTVSATADDDQWVAFIHNDPSLFVEETTLARE